MAYSIRKDECIDCGACIPECPVDAISEQDSACYIDADECTSCGACVDICPVDCIDVD